MSSSAKENPHCLICNSRVGVSTRNSVQIFNRESITCTEKPLAQVISLLLEETVSEENAHSLLMCKKCFKLIDELEELEQRIEEVKDELIGNYQKTLNHINSGTDDDDLDRSDVRIDEEHCKTILEIPSSDDENSQQGEIQNVFTKEDIELQLGRIHGTDGEELDDSNTHYQNFHGEIVDSGAINHSSDSDYEPPQEDNTDLLLQAAENVEKCLEEQVNIKYEQDIELALKPNILKKKDIIEDNKKFTMVSKSIKEEITAPLVSRDDNHQFTCMLCDVENTVCGEAKAIITHLREMHDERLYICDVCGQDFRKRPELSAHMDAHIATEEGDFQCEVCNRIFCNLRLFRIHKRMHYPQNKAWGCDLCKKKYSSKNLLEEHYNTHIGVRPYQCSICGKDFASKYTFKAHEKTHEVRPRPFKCTQCEKSFLSQQNLTQHERIHSGLKEFSCQLCSKQFGSAHNLEVHSIVHTGFKPFVCNICKKAFARKAEIRDHERTHTGERPYQCEMCGSTFSQRSNLQSHKRATHLDDKRYKCKECGKGFKRRRLLDYHIKAAHTGERPYKCEECEATFVYPEHFKKHKRIHTGEKPYPCGVCGKNFNSRDNRNSHLYTHSDKKPYECLVCGSGFMRKPQLYHHMTEKRHWNDTIVINQPRMKTDDHQFVTVNSNGEMEIIEGDTIATTLQTIEMEGEDVAEDSKLFIAEHMLLEGNEVFTDDKGFVTLDHDQVMDADGIQHIIIDGQHIEYAEEGEGVEDGEDQVGDEHILGTTEDFAEIVRDGKLINGTSEIVQDGSSGRPVYVKVRLPTEDGTQQAWLQVVTKE